MNREQYKEDELLFDDLGEIKELDFGNKTDEKVQEEIKFVDDNLATKLEKSGKKISFAKDILALYRYMKDPFVKWYRKSVVVAALIYFIVPIDSVPDFAPMIGYLDDLGVIAALLKFLGSELKSYYSPGYRS
ncbi:MAG TPA: YkvA family protein [Ignavibacteriaceae bacterium]